MKTKSKFKKEKSLHHPNHWNTWEKEYNECHYQDPKKWTFWGLCLLAFIVMALVAVIVLH